MRKPETKIFRHVLLSKQTLLGTFIKTPTSHSTEIVGRLGYDFVIIDAEHGPFDRGSIDVALLAARAVGTAGLVRVSEATATQILTALDCGAVGIVAPHIDSAAKAEMFVANCRYEAKRGFSNSPRAGSYGDKNIWEHVDESDRSVTTIAMIEDFTALQSIDAIVAVEGLDAIFVGRGDLQVALKDRSEDMSATRNAADRIIAAAHRAGKAIFVLAASITEARALLDKGVTAFVISSDQGFIRAGASAALESYRAASISVNANFSNT